MGEAMACKQADAPYKKKEKKMKKGEEDRKRMMVVMMIIITTVSWSISCDESNALREFGKKLNFYLHRALIYSLLLLLYSIILRRHEL
jgi:hypothetical protein